MKILNLLEIIQSEFKHRTSNNSFNFAHGERERKQHSFSSPPNPNSGYYGRVYSNGDPHTVNKKNYLPVNLAKDGYATYIKYLIDNKIAEHNPFAPRVYKMNVVKNINGLSKYKIQLEALHKTIDQTEEVLTSIIENLYNKKDIDFIKKRSYYSDIVLTSNYLASMLARLIELTAHGEIKSKNELLNNLCEKIDNIVESDSRNFGLDIHKSNIMIRLSPYPQVVIVDPISN